MKPNQPALIPSMPEAEYHGHPALSSTGARKLLPPSTPAEFDWERRNPTAPTKAMILGKAAHRLALGVGAHIEVSDEWQDFRKADAQAWRDEVLARDEVPMLASSADYQTLMAMRDALRAHADFPRLFSADRGDAEVSAFWTDKATGVECRARFDFLPHAVKGRRLIVPDYKKSEKVDPAGFARACADYGHPMQADWYLRGVRALGLDRDPAFVFVTQSPKPPYLVAIHQITDADMRLAAARNDAALRIFARCTETGQWPGWPGVNQLEVPAYWRNQTEDLLDQLESENAA